MINKKVALFKGKEVRKRIRKVMVAGAVICTCMAGTVFCVTSSVPPLQKESIQASVADKIIRFHVIANSDEEWDQAVKMKVRDGVLCYLQPLLKDCENREESERVINENMQNICQCAQGILKENGCMAGVTAQLEKRYFPIKKYGEYTFPEGEYEALCIEIGEAKGKNWWCVLYPKLCFTDALYCVTEEDGKEQLKEVLSDEEYEEVLRSEDTKIVVKSRFLEWVEQLFE